jgi:deoxyribonuclease (pyrimidine dimer)
VTRLNLVPVEELYDQHLFAEFREIKMVPKALARSLRAALRHCKHGTPVEYVLDRVPPVYVLGTGHVSFFYNKGMYLQQRYSDLCRELARRGINYDRNALLDPDYVFEHDYRLRGDYYPTPEALALVRTRIALRVADKPTWYRKTK